MAHRPTSLVRRAGFIAALAALLALSALTAVASAGGKKHGGWNEGPSWKVVASGLDNPRGLTVAPWGDIYVAEAGRGGTAPCIEAEGPEGGQICVGETGAITKVSRGKQRRVLSGLPSAAAPGTGDDAGGPQDVALTRRGLLFPVGLGANPAERDNLGDVGARLGKLYKAGWRGVREVADIAGYEASANPDGGEEPDSNPNSVVSWHGRAAVADAGGNDLLKVGRKGRISTLAVFPDRVVPAPAGIPDLPPELPMQSVPTSVAVGPDGALYVGELTGFPFVKGAARVHRVVPGKGSSVYATGFTNVTDIAFDRRGNLYVLEFAKDGLLAGPPVGAVHRVDRKGARKTLVSEGLTAPTGIAVGHKGELYVSNKGSSAGTGEVVRIRP